MLPGFAAIKLAESIDAQGSRLSLRLPASMVAGLARRLRDLSGGAAILEITEAAGE